MRGCKIKQLIVAPFYQVYLKQCIAKLVNISQKPQSRYNLDGTALNKLNRKDSFYHSKSEIDSRIHIFF